MQLWIKVVIIIIILIVIVWLANRKVGKMTEASYYKPENKQKAKPKILKLLPPQNIKVNADGSNVNITWEPCEGAKSYTLHYSTSCDKDNFRTISGIDGEEFQISKVPKGEYYIRLSCTDGVVESEMSNVEVLSIETCNLPPPPKEFRSKIVKNDNETLQVLLSWTPDVTLDGYILHVNYQSPPMANGSDHMVIKIEDPETANRMLEGLDNKFKWYATSASVAAHCGEGEPSNWIVLN